MYKHIMVAIDGSDVGNLALKEAVRLAKDQRAKLHIVHVLDELVLSLGINPSHLQELERSLIGDAKEMLNKAKEKARKQGLKADVALLKTFKNVSDKLAEEANKASVDLIIIGTHGRRGINRFLLGSVAEKLVRIATVPVLLVRGK